MPIPPFPPRAVPTPRRRRCARACAIAGSARAALAALAALALSALTGCVGQMDPVGPLSAVGVVEGRVLEDHIGVPAQLRFTRQRAGDGGLIAAEFTVPADSSGWYRAELPIGLYRIRLTMAGSGTSSSSVADTIMVGRAVRRRDFERGRARLSIRLPAPFEDSELYVWLYHRDRQASDHATVTDGVAAIDMRLVPASIYTVSVDPGYDHDQFYLPGTYASAEADSLLLGFDEAVREYDLRPRHASISGRVTGTWRSGPGGMNVGVYSHSGRKLGSAQCDDDGAYRFDTLMPEPVRLAAESSWVRNWFADGPSPTPASLDLQAGDHLEGLDLVVGGLRVTYNSVRLGYRGSPAMTLHRTDGLSIPVFPSGYNPVPLGNLPPGDYRLHIEGFCEDDPWMPQWYPGVTDSAAAGVIAITAGSWSDVTVDLDPGGSLSGRLVFPEYGSDDWVGFDLCDADGARLCTGSFGASDGAFRVDGLPDGSYCLAMQQGATRWWYPGTASLAEAARIAITDAAVVDGLVWMMMGAVAPGQP